MKILFIGIVDFSYHCLEIVLKKSGDVCGIVTSQNSNNNSDFKDLTPLANEYNIPILYCSNINNPETIDWIINKKPDVIFCWGWSQLIKKKLLDVAPMGVVGVHPALLPANRGRHPIIWALFLGLKETGLSFFFMDEDADSGPILSQQKIGISDIETASTLYEKIKSSARIQISNFLPELISGKYKKTYQDITKANYWRKRSINDGLIDWRMSANAIINLIRALTRPYPGAQFEYKEQNITIWQASMYNDIVLTNDEPGKIINLINKNPVIKCYDGAILIEEFEPRINFVKGDYIL